MSIVATVWRTSTRSLGLLLLVLGTSVATHSVVRYELWIVVTYTALAVALAASLVRGAAGPRLTRGLVAAALVAVAVCAVKVHAYTYLQRQDASAVRWSLAVTAVVAAAALLLAPRRGADVALGVSVLGYLSVAVALIRLDPAPKIDVWVTLQQAADAIARGENVYTQIWKGSPGVQDAFTYLPGTAVLLAPGRWAAGDVRWALVAVTLLAVLAIRLLPGRDAPAPARVAAASAGVLLVLLPGTSTQVEQAWTEPLLLACLAFWALGVRRGSTLLAVVALALGVASKQHLVLLLPILAAWPRFGLRRTVAAGGLAGVLVLPWFLASPADMWHDTVTLLVSFQPLRFADTLFIAAMHELSWTPPFWVTGAVVIGTLGGTVAVVRRRNPDLGEVLRWCALVLFVANLVNKQAFYNQYWLVAALVVLSWAVPAGAPAAQEGGESDEDEVRAARRLDRPAGAAT